MSNIVCTGSNLLSSFTPLIVSICTNRNKYNHPDLQSSATLALTKFMLVRWVHLIKSYMRNSLDDICYWGGFPHSDQVPPSQARQSVFSLSTFVLRHIHREYFLLLLHRFTGGLRYWAACPMPYCSWSLIVVDRTSVVVDCCWSQAEHENTSEPRVVVWLVGVWCFDKKFWISVIFLYDRYIR